MASSVTQALQSRFSNTVFDTKIRRLIEAVNSTAEQQSLIRMGGRLGEQYLQLTDEVIERTQGGLING